MAYGQTGSGKTHTTLGYGSERGLYHLAVEELLRRVQTYNESIVGSTSDPLMLLASVVEVYNDDERSVCKVLKLMKCD